VVCAENATPAFLPGLAKDGDATGKELEGAKHSTYRSRLRLPLLSSSKDPSHMPADLHYNQQDFDFF
jgi:hypothetical protein